MKKSNKLSMDELLLCLEEQYPILKRDCDSLLIQKYEKNVDITKQVRMYKKFIKVIQLFIEIIKRKTYSFQFSEL